ncbi:hypothetical protein [Actinoplanes sp. M2I2]|uniref:hypothetical protein n=1 Tax=Actinoplanes sp. M2I2 TaxID=1734444 RepID=UPI0020203BC4|nr:hypothetical protein [Actinoplanes sp. M2I2]
MVVSRALAVAAVAVGLGVIAPAATPASAAAAACRVNVVCVYNAGQTWMGQYSEYTSHFQSVPRSDITSVQNSTPTAVKFLYSSGNVSCVLSGRYSGLSVAGYGDVTGIRLVNENSCVF